MPATYEPIATTTLGSGTLSYTFSSIPQTYTDLRLVVITTRQNAGAGWYVGLQANGDTSSTSYGYLLSQSYRSGGTNTTSATVAMNDSYIQANQIDPGGASQWALVTFDIMQYTRTDVFKTVFTRFSNAVNSTNSSQNIGAGAFKSQSAISSLTVVGQNYNLGAGSTLTLFGIKAA